MPQPLQSPENQAVTPNLPAPPDLPNASNTQDVQPDGGVLGRAAIGALAGATVSHNETPISGPPPGAVPATTAPAGTVPANTPPSAVPYQNKNAPPPGAVPYQNPAELPPWQRVMQTEGEITAEGGTPLSGIHEAANAIENWANKEATKSSNALLSPKEAALKTGLAGTLRDVAGFAAGATTPKGFLENAAFFTPLAIPMGLYMIGHGLYNMKQGVGNLENPDDLQKFLNNAAGITGGAVGVRGGVESAGYGLSKYDAYKAARPEEAEAKWTDFKNAVPPSKTAPYTEADYKVARPYLEQAATTGTPIRDIPSLVDAADSAISKIENTIGERVSHNADTPVVNDQGRPINVLADVETELSTSVRSDFLKKGLAELKNYPQLEQPLTLQAADDIRHQLNAENRSVANSLNKYDHATLLQTDPAYAAREAAAEALRTGIYETLRRLGFGDSQQLRLEEGSLMKIRDAAERQRYAGEKRVAPKKTKMGGIREWIKKSAAPLGTAAGFEVGAAVGHPVLGAGMGSRAAERIGEKLSPAPMTKDELVNRAFAPKPVVPPAPSPKAPLVGMAASNLVLPPNMMHVRASDGNEFFIPADQLSNALQADPNLEILRK